MLLMRALRRPAVEDDATETLEWGLVAGLIVVGAIAAITLIGPKVKNLWDGANAQIP
jgi:Flp pilus assembly pilin Flp